MSITYVIGVVLLTVATTCYGAPRQVPMEASTNETEAGEWFAAFDKRLGDQKYMVGEASWARATNITEDTEKKYVEASLKYVEFLQAEYDIMTTKFNYSQFKDADLKRRFEKAADIGTSAVKDETKQKRLSELVTQLSKFYNVAEVPDPNDSSKKMPLEPDLVRIMSDPTAAESLKRYVWKGWRDASGKPMRATYKEFVELSNEMIKAAGYDNIAQYWQSWYETENFEKMMDDLWTQLKPFYEQLHAYVRHKLRIKYGGNIFPPTGQIPAHITGNMWAQSWANIESLTTPYPNVNKIDITDRMKALGWNATKMFRVSEDFFYKIGLKNMSDTFWKKSVITKIPNVQMVCHASAWDFYTGNRDFRIKQCTDITQSYLGTTHHEMGHIQYFEEYEHQPVVYRGGANPGFHEAVGDTIELSVMTPEHLKEIGLLEQTIDSKEYYINYLYSMALKKIAFIPFGFLMDKWRWRVYDGTTKSADYNKEWWKLRCSTQGVSSPYKRSESDFDPGSKYHIPSNTPYIRYFISHVLQFHFYKAMCDTKGHTGPLYKCDVYGHKGAGEKLKAALREGSSKVWPIVLEAMTGTKDMTVAPLLEYFKDLQDYLKQYNTDNNVKVGWQDACPDDSWYDKSSTSTKPMAAIFMTVVVVAIKYITL